MNRRRSLLALALVVVLGGVALAASYVETYDPLMSAPAVVLSSPLSSADSTDVTATPVRPKSTKNCSRVVIAPTLSENGATACLAVILYQKTGSTYAPVLVAAVNTFTGSLVPTMDTGRFATTDGYIVVPTLGCQAYDVRLFAISAGNVTWRSYPLGTGTEPSTTGTGF